MNLRKLYEHLDSDARRILHATADKAAREGRGSISIEHFLLALMRDRGIGREVVQALDRAGIEAAAVESALAGKVSLEPRQTAGRLPSFDESLAHLLREAWSLTFDEYGQTSVSPIRFFETIVRYGDAWPQLVASLPSLDRADVASLAVSGGRPQEEQVASSLGVGSGDSQFPELSRYGRDMVALARDGKFDPVWGFGVQRQAVSSILMRRRQNSVVVVGQAGVGKTACALGFIDALSRSDPSIPATLRSAPVWELDVSALRAGAVVRGALEERLQAIVKEVQGLGMILFVDDIHLLFGDQSHGGDALRSILGNETVRILGTCGWREWRRYFEPDPGLARRVASVRIQEPDHADALSIIQASAPVLAEHHKVTFDENVLEAAVSLSRRYIVGRQLPDKAIAVLDAASSRALMRQADEGEARDDATADGSGVRMIEGDVTAVISDLTGVPTGSMLTDVSKVAVRLEQTLVERVVGQDGALARCSGQVRAYLAGLSDRRRPVGALMFCGPSGVGKTETAHALADILFGGRLLTINMSEYQEAHTVSGLKGAPAGYVGYGEGGVLTEGIRRTPYCVVLLDEIEKAHSDVIEMLYQVLDRGWMEDAEGIEADFSNALIVLTSNVGDAVMDQAANQETPPTEDELERLLNETLARSFPAAFVGRLQVVPYWPLGESSLMKIADMRLSRLAEAYQASHRAPLEFDDDVRAWLTDRVRSTPQGARYLDRIIARLLRPTIAEYVLDRLEQGISPGAALVQRSGDDFAVVPLGDDSQIGEGDPPDVGERDDSVSDNGPVSAIQ